MSTYHFCGLDFGTSNSTIGIYKNNQYQLVPLQNNKPTLRSAIFYDNELKQFIFGQTGIDTYMQGNPGRLMMSLKSVLGTSLMHEKTWLANRLTSYAEILGYFIQYLKKIAENMLGTELTQVIVGRPVRFHDTDKTRDQAAQAMLENIMRAQGFQEVFFQYEPIAAAKTYAQTVTREEIALIVDLGGGTSDFTIIRLAPQQHTHAVLANHGIHIGGTDIDKLLSWHTIMPLLGLHSLMRGSSSDIELPTAYYHDLTTWHRLHDLYSAKTLEILRQIYTAAHEKHLVKRLLDVISHKQGHHILAVTEIAKQELSDINHTILNLSFIEDNLTVSLSRAQLNEIITDICLRLTDTIHETLRFAQLTPGDITAIFYTGGTTKIPLIQQQIQQLLPRAAVVEGDVFGSVGMGLTIDAGQRFKP